ncbi:hypothetical protein [Alsobacter sp. R-9]
MTASSGWTRTALATAMAVAGFVAARPALAQDCTWGQPGYRDCVDAKIRKLKEAEASGQAKPSFPTAPANRRAPQLTPLTDYDIEQPVMPAPPGSADPRAMRQNQKALDRNLTIMRRDAVRPPIMPPTRDPFPPIPGRICPSQGC